MTFIKSEPTVEVSATVNIITSSKAKQDLLDKILKGHVGPSPVSTCPSDNSVLSIKKDPEEYSLLQQYWLPMSYNVKPKEHSQEIFSPGFSLPGYNDAGSVASPFGYSFANWNQTSNPGKMKTVKTSVDISSLKPVLQWNEIVELAILCNGNQPTTQIQIYDFVERHMPFFALNRKRSSWTGSVRSKIIYNKNIDKDATIPICRIKDDVVMVRVAVIRARLQTSPIGIKDLDFINSQLNKF